MSAYGVMFHHFFNGTHPRGQGAISAQNLEDMIHSLGRDNVLPAEEWMRRALSGKLGDKDICLTFDDALKCQYDVAVPVLKALDLTAFWFVYSSVFQGNLEVLEIYRHFRTTEFVDIDDFYAEFFAMADALYPAQCQAALAQFDPDSYLSAYPFYTRGDRIFRYLRDDVLGVERYQEVMQSLMDKKGFDTPAASAQLWMRDEDLRTLHDAGHVIGLHSYTHPTRLCELSADRQKAEYQKNFDHLRAVLAEAPLTMSHPCNSYSDDTIAILRGMGVKLGFRANMQKVEKPSAFEFPRQDHANLMKELCL